MEWSLEQILLLTITTSCQANLCDSIYKVKSVCSMNYGTALSTYTNFRGRAWCTIACSQDNACMSSVYDTAAGTCQTFSEYKRIDLCVTEEYYTAVFESTCHVPPIISGRIHGLCDWDHECDVPDSECRSMKCQCLPGLSHDPKSNTCVTNCTEYGNKFQEDPDHLIVGYADVTLGISDPVACMSACVNEVSITCRSIEIWKSAGLCYLSTETASTQPGYRSLNADYDLYQRDCAP